MTGRLSKSVLIGLAFAVLSACLFIPSASAEALSTVSGRVIDAETGKGLPDVTVCLQVPYTSILYIAKTDKNGLFVITKVYPAKYIIFAGATEGASKDYVAHQDWELSRGGKYESVAVESGKNVVNLNIALKKGGGVKGRILTSDGQPIAGVFVNISSKKSTEKHLDADKTIKTDEYGRYQINGLPESDDYKVVFDSDGYPNIGWSGITIKGGEILDDGDYRFNLDESTGIKGRVTDPNGNPIQYAAVFLKNTEGLWLDQIQTDANGNYQFKGLSPKSYTILFFSNISSPDFNIIVESGKMTEFNYQFTAPMQGSSLKTFVRGASICWILR